MRQFINRALRKIDKLTLDQIRVLFSTAASEIERLETVLDSLSEGLMVFDASYKMVLANKYAKRHLLNDSKNKKNCSLKELLRNENAAQFLEKTLTNGDKADAWEFVCHSSGHEKIFAVTVLPLVKDSKIIGTLVRVADVTNARSRQERMRRMENLASLTTVAAGVAHEIKNPLGGLSIHVQLIQKILSQTKHNKILDKHISIVNEEIDRLNKIVVDFLFAVRPMNLELRRADINKLVNDISELIILELDKAGLKYETELAENLPLLDYDERVMKQALLNLVKNAIHAMEDGGRLVIKTGISDNNVYISVSDTGTGIPEENLSKIFEPYFTTKNTGIGLGLTLVFKIIREHQGEINVTSETGKGSVFTITLPLPQTETKLIGAPQ